MRKCVWKQLFSGFLAVSMLLSMSGMPVAAQSLEKPALESIEMVQADAEQKEVTYLDENGVSQTVWATPLPTAGSASLKQGWYIAEDTVYDKWTFYSINKDVHLILADGCRIELVNGISVSDWMGGKLSIYAQSDNLDTMGELIITTSESSSNPAIGNSSVAGDITINGGKITATAHNDAAAIGSGKGKSGGNITINGGIVKATTIAEAGKAGGGAAIGGGSGSGNQNGGDGGNIVINGGTVTAIAQSGGAGIGGGGGSGSTGTSGGNGGSITINGGAVYAESTNGGAGIGGGSGSNSGTGGSSGDIRITGGEVTAISSAVKVGIRSTYKGAGIGSGHSGVAAENNGSVEITGGIVTATGGGDQFKAGAGIGGGYQSTGGIITIAGGTVTTNSGYDSYPDIGAGSSASGADIRITGGTIHDSQGEAETSNLPTCDGSTGVYATMVDLTAEYGASTQVTEAELENYGFSDVYTDKGGKVYLYLPEGETTAYFQGTEYSGTVTEEGLNELKKTGLTLHVEIAEVTTNSAKLHITATSGSTIYYAESDTPLTDLEQVVSAAGEQKITMDETGISDLSLENLTLGETYYYYFAAKLSDKVSGVVSVEVTPAATSLEDAQITLTGSDFVYNGTSQKPEIQVVLGDKTLVEGKDYTVHYQNTNGGQDDCIHAGTVTVTVTGMGLYSGTADQQPTYVIAQKPVTAQVMGSVSKSYDGTTTIVDPQGLSVVVQGILQDDVVTAEAEAYSYQTADVGEGKGVVAQNVSLSGADAANYVLTGEVQGAVGTIVKGVPVFEFQNYDGKAYDGEPMSVPHAGQLTITGGDFEKVLYQWYQEDGSTPLADAPVDAGRYVLKASLEATSNTEAASVMHTVTITKASYQGPQSATGIIIAGVTSSILLPELPEGAAYGLPTTLEGASVQELKVENGRLFYTGSDQVQIGMPYIINIPVVNARNYQDYTVMVTVMGSDAVQVIVSMDQIQLSGKTYDGESLRYTGEATANGYNGSFVYEWYDAQGMLMAEAPVNAGTYTLRATVTEPGMVGIGEKSVVIQKASLVIRADNQSVQIGNKMPELTYTVHGLVGKDTLLKEPKLTCDANLKNPGQYEIQISDADAGDNYKISYKPGILKVWNKEQLPTIPTPRPDPTPSYAQWVENDQGWQYRLPDGRYLTDEWKYLYSDRGSYAWYWFDENGYVATGWKKIDSTWYYMNAFGEMQTGWKQIGGSWYYLKSNGAMATGWQYIDDAWYYLKDWGGMAAGWQYINGVWYYLKPNGVMATGWQNINGVWYYLKDWGGMATGWQFINGNWYYFYAGGSMAADTVTPDGFRVNQNGAWIA